MSITNSLQCSIVERNLEIIHNETNIYVVQKKFTDKVVQKKGKLQFEMYMQRLQEKRKLR